MMELHLPAKSWKKKTALETASANLMLLPQVNEIMY
jgi:hypothetical protein